ncbi:hypothetical protein P4K49_27170 [Bacillus cereus]|uniref:hypothetical protein n=1 Tax=Bacillus thuringiensis TaxID=1428 RepID=UPI000676B92F|nr:hypothetical protein [Bacillus thuringiensis]MEB8879385.1 hypothetical protein [Bacillus cereus]AKR38930.1 Hypothetical protein NF53_p5177 [Bacillus thuringiensis serovar indiana]MEB9619178.1 hypothetical protein [Bacillus cereus]MEB9640609.1 hypothetical protein [Bacillus cereus]MEB9643975.1 hypothetical protein [Bacillus cereus]
MGFAILIIIMVIIFVLCTVDFEAIYGMLQKNLFFISEVPSSFNTFYNEESSLGLNEK